MEKNSTLERLLRIQGNPQQVTLEAAMEETRAPAPVSPVPPGAMNQQREQQSNSAGKISPAEREAWSSLYRLYEKYAPQLRAAALLEDGYKEASQIFREVARETNELYQERGLIGKTLSVSLYCLMEEVYKEASAQAF